MAHVSFKQVQKSTQTSVGKSKKYCLVILSKEVFASLTLLIIAVVGTPQGPKLACEKALLFGQAKWASLARSRETLFIRPKESLLAG